jgi:hypothetical protein
MLTKSAVRSCAGRSERVPYVSPIERSGLEVTGGTLNHNILPVETHHTLFCVAIPRGSGNFREVERESVHTRYPLGSFCSKLRDCAGYFSLTTRDVGNQNSLLKDYVYLDTFLSLPLE